MTMKSLKYLDGLFRKKKKVDVKPTLAQVLRQYVNDKHNKDREKYLGPKVLGKDGKVDDNIKNQTLGHAEKIYGHIIKEVVDKTKDGLTKWENHDIVHSDDERLDAYLLMDILRVSLQSQGFRIIKRETAHSYKNEKWISLGLTILW